MAPRPRLLVVDDDPLARELVQTLLAPEGLAITSAASGEQALAAAAAAPPDAVVLDLHLPDASGVEVLERLLRQQPELPVVMLTGDGDIPTAVQATRLGAFAYLRKGLDVDELLVVVRRALERRAMVAEIADLKRRLADGGGLARAMGPSAAVRRIAEQVAQVAPSDFTVLLQGETGTGKDVVARAIHDQSPRRDGPFVALDCGALPETLVEAELFGHEKGAFTGADKARPGHFRLAAGGTLFLDEVANLPLALQAKLLRVLQDRQARPVGGSEPVALDVRFVAATNKDLGAAVRAGEFREDLFFRLAEFTIALPPLRARLDDLPWLAWRFAEEAGVELRRPITAMAEDALALLRAHGWPGNVRELRNVVRFAVLRASSHVLGAADIEPALNRLLPAAAKPAAPQAPPMPPAAGRSLREIAAAATEAAEKAAIASALVAANGNKTEAARALGTDPKTLHLKARRYGLGG